MATASITIRMGEERKKQAEEVKRLKKDANKKTYASFMDGKTVKGFPI